MKISEARAKLDKDIAEIEDELAAAEVRLVEVKKFRKMLDVKKKKSNEDAPKKKRKSTKKKKATDPTE